MGTHYTGDESHRQALDAFIKLIRAADSVSARAHRNLGQNGLTVSQFGVLEALHHLGPLCQKELAAKLLRSNGNLTTVVTNLERRGLVQRTRDREDRRFVRVELTPAGLDLIGDLFPVHTLHIAEQMTVLTTDELDLLGQLCRKVGRAETH